jgi:hypothetical protein
MLSIKQHSKLQSINHNVNVGAKQATPKEETQKMANLLLVTHTFK